MLCGPWGYQKIREATLTGDNNMEDGNMIPKKIPALYLPLASEYAGKVAIMFQWVIKVLLHCRVQDAGSGV